MLKDASSAFKYIAKSASLWIADKLNSETEIDTYIKRSHGTATKGQEAGLQRSVTPGFEEMDRQSIRRDRMTAMREIHEMIAVDPRIDKQLRKLASDASLNRYTVVVRHADSKRVEKQAQQIIDKTRKNINDHDKLKGWTKSLLRDGDLFFQLVVDKKENEITRLKKIDASITYSRLNAEGDFPADKKPYYQESPAAINQIEREFDLWEIVHAKWDEEDGKPYGKSLYYSTRLAWRRLDEGERNIVIRRAVRAGFKLHHTLGTEDEPADWDEIKKYKKRTEDSIQNPTAPNQDYYTAGNVKIGAITGDVAVDSIGDLQHFEGILSIATGIPNALISGGREASTNFAVIKEQEEDYLRNLSDINDAIQAAFTEVFNRALLLKLINPDGIIYEYKWGAKDREALNIKIEQGILMQSLGFSFETTFDHVNLEDVTVEQELERIKKQKEEQIVPYGTGMRLDTAIAQSQGILPQNEPAENGPNAKDSGYEGEGDVDDRTKYSKLIIQQTVKEILSNGR